jgi:ligand-binding sensor domain-containing protein
MPDAIIVSMVVFQGSLYVATSEGVYVKDANGVFHKLQIGG